jgi:phage terminase small subunit
MSSKKKSAIKLKTELTPQNELFCLNYIILGRRKNVVTQSAIAAGYSARSAHSTGSRLLTDPLIKARISELTEESLRAVNITKDMIVEETAIMAFYDLENCGLGHSMLASDKRNALKMLGEWRGLWKGDIANFINLRCIIVEDDDKKDDKD